VSPQTSSRRAAPSARRITGGLLLLYGLVLAVVGLGTSDPVLTAGIALLVVVCVSVAWALLRPMARGSGDAEAAGPERATREERRFTKAERSDRVADRVPGTR
jgi:hypothetical protein